MKRDLTLVRLLMAIGIIGILAALLIPNTLSVIQKSKLNSNKKEIMLIAANVEDYIPNFAISERDKNSLDNYLENIKTEILSLSPGESLKELKIQTAFVEEKLDEVRTPEKWVKAASPDLVLSPLENYQLRLARLEAKIELFAEERITKWDVAYIDIFILGGLGAIIVLLKFLFQISPKKYATSKPIKKVKKNTNDD